MKKGTYRIYIPNVDLYSVYVAIVQCTIQYNTLNTMYNEAFKAIDEFLKLFCTVAKKIKNKRWSRP